MNDSFKTLIFVGTATTLSLFAAWSHFNSQPKNSGEFELVGKPFFENFDSSSQIKSLEVVAINPQSGVAQQFRVAESDGLWTIPSHNNYPAEAVERLAKTAASVMGIQREALAGRLESEHERLGVVDPLDENLEDPETAGQRITLKDGQGEPIVDLIIGKEVEDSGVEQEQDLESIRANPLKSYYVRRADEQQTYKVALDIDLSTKFSDWIDPDLLQFDRSSLTKLEVDNYTLEEARTAAGVALVKSQGDQLNLTRTGNGAWNLDGIDEAKEDVNNVKVNEVIDVLDQVKIAGVRSKFKYKGHLLLTADLKLNEQEVFNEDKQEFGLAIREMQDDLGQKGFSLASDGAGGMELVSNNGTLKLGTDEGVLYTLNVGDAIEGTEEEIEVGGTKPSKKDEPKPDSEGEAEGENEGEKTGSTDVVADPVEEMSNADAANRYLMVRVSFAEALVADRPVKPVEPVKPFKPEGYTPVSEKAEDAKADAAPDDVTAPPATEGQAKPEGDSATEQESDPPQDTRKPEFVAYEEALKRYDQNMAEYNLATAKYEEDMKDFEKAIEAGKKRVDELNQRFGDWYYVISADNLKTLQVTRSSLVKPKEGKPENQAPSRPDIGFPNIPGLEGLIPSDPEPSNGSDEMKDEDGEDGQGGEGGPGADANKNAAPETPSKENEPKEDAPKEDALKEDAPEADSKESGEGTVAKPEATSNEEGKVNPESEPPKEATPDGKGETNADDTKGSSPTPSPPTPKPDAGDPKPAPSSGGSDDSQ